MGTEIERKFLVRRELLPELVNGVRIIQGYLAEKPSVRFRIMNDSLILTVKYPQPDGSRFEVETEKLNPTEDEKLMLPGIAIYPPIEKIRYRLDYAGLTWEIDVYQQENAGLITADVELSSWDQSISFPEWIDVEADITRDPQYFNQNLGIRPFSTWLKKLE